MSFDSLKQLFMSYRSECLLVIISLVTILLSLFFFVSTTTYSSEPKVVEHKAEDNTKQSQILSEIIVDLSGAVNKPDVYTLTSTDRLKDVIEKAGGLSENADILYFQRNFNLASKLVDQQKIYIPSVNEVINNELTFSNISTQNYTAVSSNIGPTDKQKININIATPTELETLTGIGKVTAEKIIEGRPYQRVEDLLSKKIVGKSVFEKIQEEITVD
ncbi:MAG TPA: ComEA family DNA-binding protein [Candidatus Nitrosocosmicus sp.]|nr:ComEA family DNA-binding protein [Candidatus Nitrosocosmicus sp.]